MANRQKLEIEVRFLILSKIKPEDIPSIILSEEIEQGYLELPHNSGSLRIRIIDGKKAGITLKEGTGKTRVEFEENLSVAMAKQLMLVCHHCICKTRYIDSDGWEFDFFHGSLEGLVFAEYELAEETTEVVLPAWAQDWKEITDSLSNLHLARLNTELSNRGEFVDDVLKRLQPFPMIAISGGPCSGKSTLIKELPLLLPKVTIMPETATIVISQVGISPNSLHPQDFQETIFRTQKAFEEISKKMARAKGSRALVVDRGTMDGAPYLPGGIPELERVVKTTRAHEFGKYGLVLFMDMPPREVYDQLKANNPARSETYDQALPLSERTKSAWQEHPNFIVISGKNWEEKRSAAISAITRFLETCP